jgi:purine-cytosine permease-like protein
VPELPPPLPPETRTVGQLVAESIRFYQRRFWAVLATGLSLAVVEQVTAGQRTPVQVVVLAASAPLMAASFVRASQLVTGSAWSWVALAAGTLVFLPVPFLMLVYLLPAVAWLALFGLAVPAAVAERLGFRDALARGRRLGTADYVHALGGIATLAIVYALSKFVLVLLLKGQADIAVRAALFLADVVLSPLLFVGTALLYADQAARARRRPELAVPAE